jgi:hypothetical protein
LAGPRIGSRNASHRREVAGISPGRGDGGSDQEAYGLRAFQQRPIEN